VQLVFLLAFSLVGFRSSFAETPEEAIRRIQAGRHSQMPPPTTAPASGPAGKGMTIENGTGYALHVHFSGPMNRTVVVADGKSESVELAVGDYQVAAEVPGSTIVPFYGRQAYQPFTHYWLKFYTQRADAPSQRAASPAQPPGLSSPGQPTQAEATYRQFCVACHAQTGGYGVALLYLNPRPSDFVRKPRDEIRRAMITGRGAMPSWTFLPAQELERLIDHVVAVAGNVTPSHPGFDRDRASTLLAFHGVNREVDYHLEVLRRNGMVKIFYPDRPGVCVEIGADRQMRAIPLPPSANVDLSMECSGR
jgi:mono/diheme cytochrome c family protein